ncbi:hypothetical protein ACS0TY_024490 [Phlomoides rotata]
MERDFVNLEWENLALGKSIEIPPFSVSSLHSNDFSSYDDLMTMHTAVSEPMIGLRLGSHKDSSTPAPTKRSRASYHNMQNPCCQVEGCNLDLKSAKDYHRRHRICETHSKTPKVIVAGKERRFCQQCSRFHDLSEFDDKKRSCRRRLSDHNARRRRVQPESIQLSSAGLSSALYAADQRQQNVLLSGLPISLSNSTWDHNATTRHTLIRPSKPRGLDGTLNFSSDHIHNSLSNLHMDSDSIHASNPRALDQCLQVPSTNPSMAPDLLNAHSLLSTNAWSLKDGESTSMEGLVHGNYSQVMRHSDSESHHLSLFHPNNVMHSVNLHDEASSHQQEYRLFKSPYDSDHAFYSSHRYL